MERRRLLDNDELTRSAVVANNAMNRERQLTGPNSYTRELGFNPLDRLTGPADTVAGWLDVCCGTGRALIQGAEQLRRDGRAGQVTPIGVDLVHAFDPTPAADQSPQLICSDLATWTTTRRFDLITCVHGLHYIGDKLALLCRAADWLTGDGLMVAGFDPASIRLPDGRPAGRTLTTALRQAGFSYDGPPSGPWAAEQGLEVSDRGRIKAEILDAYEAAENAPAPAKRTRSRKAVTPPQFSETA